MARTHVRRSDEQRPITLLYQNLPCQRRSALRSDWESEPPVLNRQARLGGTQFEPEKNPSAGPLEHDALGPHARKKRRVISGFSCEIVKTLKRIGVEIWVRTGNLKPHKPDCCKFWALAGHIRQDLQSNCYTTFKRAARLCRERPRETSGSYFWICFRNMKFPVLPGPGHGLGCDLSVRVDLGLS